VSDGADTVDAVPTSLADAAVKPDDPEYPRFASTYFRGGAPAIVLLPRTVEQVVDAVGYARRNLHLALGIRSGGHGLSGRSTNEGGIVIDLRHLDSIEVLDPDARLVRIGPGARWRDVAAVLQRHGWALSSGDSGAVGVGGLATAGGIGLLARAQGLTIDRLVAAEVVLANGSVVVVNERRNRELFWAVRGAGAKFGVVSSFDFVVEEVDEIGLALMTHVVDDPASFLVAFGEIASTAPRDTTAELLAGPGGTGPLALTTAVVVDSADHDTIAARTTPFLKLAPAAQHQVLVTPYAGLMNLHPAWQQDGRGDPVGHSGLLSTLTAAFAADVAALLRSGSFQLLQVRTLGGATADVRPEATAFAHREAQFQVNVLGAEARELDSDWERIRPHLDGIYLPFETDLDPARLAEAFPPATLARLRALKRGLDPHNLFRDNFDLDPAATNAGEREVKESHQRHLMTGASNDDRAAQWHNAVSSDPKEKP
jgi:FAD/FMN-containing dehydrogenase